MTIMTDGLATGLARILGEYKKAKERHWTKYQDPELKKAADVAMPILRDIAKKRDAAEALREGRKPATKTTALKDLKEALSSARKPDITHARKSLLVYASRAHEYGDAKYERANYMRETGTTSADFERLRSYLGASLRHIFATLDSMEAHLANDPSLQDLKGMRAAVFAADDDVDASGKVGPSGLPHLCGAVASLSMAIEQATRSGLLPADPGQPWAK